MSAFRLLSMTLALSTTISVAGCGTDADRLAAAGGRKAEAGVVDNALDLARAERRLAAILPEMPADCRRTVAAGIAAGDRLDVAVLKADRALTLANARLKNCAQWYADLRGRLIAGGQGDAP